MTISCGLCWNIDSRKIIWPPRAHFGSENESLKGLSTAANRGMSVIGLIYLNMQIYKAMFPLNNQSMQAITIFSNLSVTPFSQTLLDFHGRMYFNYLLKLFRIFPTFF